VRNVHTTLLLILLTSWPAARAGVQTPTPEELLRRAEATLQRLQDYQGKLLRKELIRGRLVEQFNTFKFARPFQVYLGFIEPFPGREVIYRQRWNDGQLRVHKGSFPDITVSLDPRGATAMKRSHHPITEFGLENTVRLIAVNLRRAIRRGEGDVRISEGGDLFGRQVWKIGVAFPRGGRVVTVGEDETLWDVARRSGQDMYWILHSNLDAGYEDPDDVDAGDRVFVPRYYGARAEFFLDKENGLPLRIVTFDRRGRLYESYEYPEICLNPGLSARDFDPDNPAYDF
jgi:hypothetical protein